MQRYNKSTWSYTLFGGEVIVWSYKKQWCITQHTQEAEYVAYNIATIFTRWINCYLKDLNLGFYFELIKLYYDNHVEISLLKNWVISSKSKYIMDKYHNTHEMIEKNDVLVNYISTIDIVIDSLTKRIFKICLLNI